MKNSKKEVRQKLNSLIEKQRKLVETAEKRNLTAAEKKEFMSIEKEIKGLKGEKTVEIRNGKKMGTDKEIRSSLVEYVKRSKNYNSRFLGKEDGEMGGLGHELDENIIISNYDIRATNSVMNSGVELRDIGQTQVGFMAPVSVLPRAIRLFVDHTPLWRRINIQSNFIGSLEVPILNGYNTNTFVGEFSALNSSTTTYTSVFLSAKRIGAADRISEQMLLVSGFNVLENVIEAMYISLGIQLDRLVVSGSIALNTVPWQQGTPNLVSNAAEGLVNLPTTQQVAPATSGTLTISDLINMQNSMLNVYLADAVWVMPRSILKKISVLLDGMGRPYLTKIKLATGEVVDTLLGLPVFMSDVAEDLYLTNLRETFVGMEAMPRRIRMVNNDSTAISLGQTFIGVDAYVDLKIARPEASFVMLGTAI